MMDAEPALAFAARGYHILLEKPMAVSEQDCAQIVAAASAARPQPIASASTTTAAAEGVDNKKEPAQNSGGGLVFGVCHVLRYTPTNRKIRELIQSGVIGDVVNIQHTEVGQEIQRCDEISRQSHSYDRV
jgi:predicted dehydrogenase